MMMHPLEIGEHQKRVSEHLGEIRGVPKGRAPIATIIGVVAERYGIPPTEIVGRKRHRSIFEARAVAMWVARREGYSLTQIGRAFGGRDHTTVINAVRVAEAMTEKGSADDA